MRGGAGRVSRRNAQCARSLPVIGLSARAAGPMAPSKARTIASARQAQRRCLAGIMFASSVLPFRCIVIGSVNDVNEILSRWRARSWEDDTSTTIPIRYGKDILDWWFDD